MLVAIIGGAAILSILGAVLRFIMNPIGSIIGMVRIGAFLFGAGAWLAYYMLDGREAAEVLPLAAIATIVWVGTLIFD
ncbi:hypothetical protein [Nesterenkonia alkaliphila]|uniref:Uncharacterized protein n=1 Tax=Nesterenkonia alkaliphila TaxID=1463631 RepID=A0A7K1ULC8_9MICC|nr:hypothetical protein [Nesterenkonia alkaliphila]MVT27288.1 hypothetical protein [Nesterenkonia alkaliphila]GFZ82322.1 hypothetical protein GCM10011359_08800 [Nesterenkonia alkaliphila]